MFYMLDQNNSGGSFVVNDRLTHRLFIEADSEQDAIAFAESLVCYWNGVENGYDCECCGDRWYQYAREYNSEKMVKDWECEEVGTVEGYAQYLADNYGHDCSPDARIFYKNGTVKEIFSNASN